MIAGARLRARVAGCRLLVIRGVSRCWLPGAGFSRFLAIRPQPPSTRHPAPSTSNQQPGTVVPRL